MTRLVKNRTKQLSMKDTRLLWDLIVVSRKKDSGFFQLCKDLRLLLKNGHTGELSNVPEENRVVVNLAHAHVNTLLPSLVFKAPTVTATPTHPRHEGKEKTWAGVLNGTMRKTGIKTEGRKVVRDSIVYPEGWMKLFVTKVAETEEQQEGDKVGAKEIIGPTSEDGGQVGPTAWLTKGAPGQARISPTQVIVDYRSSDRSLSGARFVSIQYLKTLSELKADPRYKDQLSGVTNEAAFIGPSASNNGWVDPFSDGPMDDRLVPGGADNDHFVILHEVWVYQLVEAKLYKQVVVLLEGADGMIVDKPIRKLNTWQDLMGRHAHDYPLVKLVYNEIPDDVPNSELGVWSSLHSATNWLTTRLVQLVADQKQIFTMDESKVKDVDAAKKEFKTGGPRTLISVNGDNAIQAVPNSHSSRDEAGLMNLVLEFSRRVSGQSENQQGADNFRTATAAAVASRTSDIKTADRVDLVGEMFKEVAMKTAAIIRSLVEEAGNTEFVFNISGDAGSVDWMHFTADDINWFPEVDIEVGSFTKPRRDEEIQKAQMAYSAALQGLPAMPNVDITILYRKLLQSMEVSGIGQIINAEQEDAMLQAAELGLLLAGGEAPVDQTQNHPVHIRIIDMFLNSAQASNVQPGVLDILLAHKDEHERLLQEIQEGTSVQPSQTENVFQTNNPANNARSDTAREREAIPPLAGAGGQRAI